MLPGPLCYSSTTVSSAMVVTGGVAHLIVVSFFLGRVSLATGSEVRGYPGQAITLPCHYSVQMHGKTAMCWSRGKCPASGCGSELIKTNGETVTSAVSEKYQLDGNIEQGDVSLTIKQLRKEDGGWYCCRVRRPGPFNDVKVNLNVLVLDEITTPNPSTTNESVHAQDANSVRASTFEGTREILSSTITTNEINSTSEQVPDDLVNILVSYLAWAARVLVFICFLAITLLLFQWKCKQTENEHLSS
ncbi:T-cell immunoglobulin and mucin domain-containing protein 4-like isoform X1 [Leucoraja erinacea]|uniref:T-cell immunoglobulin and mucin domain-containing protein 4-like isoform X1 n=1 Tax=Leucoraja erinaceus TaxID=7782 RepID=UPI00245587E4|nr:T-cell immunoglobulin and mucin domain-containing protein 4-like isoform X1 [Leucoraja erinacea]